MDEQIKEIKNICRIEYYSAIKNETMKFSDKWMERSRRRPNTTVWLNKHRNGNAFSKTFENKNLQGTCQGST